MKNKLSRCERLILLPVPLRLARLAGHARCRHPDGTCPPGMMRHRLPPPHSRYCDQELRLTATRHDRTRSSRRRYRTTGERVVTTGPSFHAGIRIATFCMARHVDVHGVEAEWGDE
ncbi:hypothetical protein [Streptomyces sp. NPDC051997]|uniref:hypothetical protein n=1 Tax=Streptomyces sp. NPDC051997 TaxID=3155611 RepID=UPI0034443D2B